jgi:hypothetical protein
MTAPDLLNCFALYDDSCRILSTILIRTNETCELGKQMIRLANS